MNAVVRILNRIIGNIPVMGTLMTPSGRETYPIAISNEVMGGPFIVNSIEELKEIPKERLVKGCKCTVNESTLNGILTATTTYQLRTLPEQTISDQEVIDGSINFADFWVIDRPRQSEEGAVEYQYAPNYKGLRPLSPQFDPGKITKERYNIGYGGEDGEVIWTANYDASIHLWIRQRNSSIADWGIPVKVTLDYEEGSYQDVMFMWKLKSEDNPTRPSSTSPNGGTNNNPNGWEDTPETPTGISYEAHMATHNLWKIRAIKGVFGDLRGEWSIPILISTDVMLVRYGDIPNSIEFFDDEFWRGYYSVGDRYKASRPDDLSDWTITLITGESGEYTDFVFKEFPRNDEPSPSDRPLTTQGWGVDGWSDGTFETTDGHVLYVSTTRKFSNGELSTGWGTPTRFDGKSTIRCVIRPKDGTDDMFKYTMVNGIKVVTPDEVVLEAVLFNADEEVDLTKYTVTWYAGNNTPVNELPIGDHHIPTISGTNRNTLTVFPDNVLNAQTYTAVAIMTGEDYIDEITIFDVTDGVGYIPVIQSNDGTIFKTGDPAKIFTGFIYENGQDISIASGIKYNWFLNGYLIKADTAPNAREVELIESQIEGSANLKLEITLGVETYTARESVVDVSDGRSIIRMFSPNLTLSANSNPDNTTGVWGSSSSNAVWAIERYSDGDWGASYRIKGEEGTMSGAFQKMVYRVLPPDSVPPIAWLTQRPVANQWVTDNLIPTAWLEDPPTGLDPGNTIYGSKATFIKNPANKGVSEIVGNWTITGQWSLPFKITHFPPPGEGGEPGDIGPRGFSGWTPVLAIQEVDSSKSIQKVVDWTGGVGAKPYNNLTQYVGSAGFLATSAGAVNIKGTPGNDGIFRASDFWDGDPFIISESYTSYSQLSWRLFFRMRKAKNGMVYYSGYVANHNDRGMIGYIVRPLDPKFRPSSVINYDISYGVQEVFSHRAYATNKSIDPRLDNFHSDYRHGIGYIKLTSSGVLQAQFELYKNVTAIYNGCYLADGGWNF